MSTKPRSRLDPSGRSRGCARLDRQVPTYREYLSVRGNAASYVRNCEAAVAHLSMWMKLADKRLSDLDEEHVAEFLGHHLPGCSCATNARHPTTVRAALGHLLIVLRAANAIAPRPLDMTEVAQELRRYDQYMEQVRGLAPKTREGALRLVQALLRKHFDSDAYFFDDIGGTALPRICWSRRSTSASSRYCWATSGWRQRACMPRWPPTCCAA